MEMNRVLALRIVALVLAALSFLMIGLSEGETFVGKILMPMSYAVAIIAVGFGANNINNNESGKIFIIGYVVSVIVLLPSIFVFYKVGAYPAVLMILSSIVVGYITEYFDEKF